MKLLALAGASLALVTAEQAHAQVGQFQTIYQDEAPTVQARYTLTLGAAPEARVSLSFTQNPWDARQPEFTLARYDRHGFAPLGLTQTDWQRLTLDDENDNNGGGGNAGAVLLGLGAVVVVGGVVFFREFEDGVEDVIDCAFGVQDCPG